MIYSKKAFENYTKQIENRKGIKQPSRYS